MIGFSMKYCCTFLLLLFLSIFGGFAQDKVECWGRYEISLLAKVTGNPFDVEFTATFSGPDTTLTVRGFYDGNDTFRIRFMPMIQGTWSYVTKSEISGLNEMRGRLECVAPSKGNHGPVKVDGTYNFKYADGTRYYPVGTTSYNWMHVVGNQPDQTVKSLEHSLFVIARNSDL